MKTFFKSIITVSCLAGVALATTSCLERVFSESEPTLSTDVKELVISSDSFEGAEILNDTIFVTSNRSWSANFVEDVDWVSLDDEENLNLSKCSKVFPLVVRFSDNKAEVDRTATLRISTEFASKEIKITQRAIAYRLVLGEGTDERVSTTATCYTAEAGAEEDSFVLKVNSNMPWTAKILSSSTALVSLDKTEGQGIEDLTVSFKDNDDRENEKSATVLISSKGSDDLKVEFKQAKSEPFARVLSTDFDGRNVSSMGGRVVFTIKSNADFVVKVKDGEELKGGIQVARRDQSGAQMKDETDRLLYDYPSSYAFQKGTSTVTVACFGNTDFDNDKTITFQLIAEEKTVKEQTLTLDKLSKVFVGFRKYPHTYDAAGACDLERNYDPFNINLWVSTRCPSNNPEIDAFNGYHFVMHTFGTCYPTANATARTYLGSGKGLVMGAGYHYTCVTLPAVPGKKLSAVTVGNGSTSVSTKWLKYGVVTPECAAKIASFEIDPTGSSATLEEQLTTVSGGEFCFCAPTVIKNVTYLSPEDEMAQNTTATTAPSWHTFELSGTQENTAYTLVCLYATTIRWIDLQYK